MRQTEKIHWPYLCQIASHNIPNPLDRYTLVGRLLVSQLVSKLILLPSPVFISLTLVHLRIKLKHQLEVVNPASTLNTQSTPSTGYDCASWTIASIVVQARCCNFLIWQQAKWAAQVSSRHKFHIDINTWLTLCYTFDLNSILACCCCGYVSRLTFIIFNSY